jgi:hypothetical protein
LAQQRNCRAQNAPDSPADSALIGSFGFDKQPVLDQIVDFGGIELDLHRDQPALAARPMARLGVRVQRFAPLGGVHLLLLIRDAITHRDLRLPDGWSKTREDAPTAPPLHRGGRALRRRGPDVQSLHLRIPRHDAAILGGVQLAFL